MSDSDTKYNGWTNYPTWNIALWIGNDEGSSRYWDEQADNCLEQNTDDPDNAVQDLAKQLEAEHDEIAANVLEGNGQTGDMSASWVADLLQSALSEVNWHEIAQGMIDEAQKRVMDMKFAI